MKSRVYVWSLMCMLVIVFSGCKTQQSAYQLRAYEAAQARSTVYQQTPVYQTTPTAPPSDYSSPAIESSQATPVDETFQTEKLTVVDGNLRQYSVVIGSFINRTNADSLKKQMQAQGYSPIVAQNEKGWYRVIVATFDTRAEATAQRNAIKSRFSDVWLLNRAY